MSGGLVTRFAPSPTGLLHLGHAYSAEVAHQLATENGGTYLIRIEDLDPQRSKPEFVDALLEDLEWLGLGSEHPVLIQSTRTDAHLAAIQRLIELDLIYPCTCTRGDIRAALGAPQEGDVTLTYPGTCRDQPMRSAAAGASLRLNLAKARELVGTQHLGFREIGPRHAGWHDLDWQAVGAEGDPVLFRHSTHLAAYHLAVVVDDAAQGITHVVRGEDLFQASFLHCLLGYLLGLPEPIRLHHTLVRDEAGVRLAKRADAKAIRAYRAAGLSPQQVRDLARGLAL